MINYILGLISAATPALAQEIVSPASGAAPVMESMAPAVTGSGMDIMHLIFQAGWVVKFVLLLLVLFSVISWAVIFSKLMVLRRSIKQNEQFQAMFWHAKSLGAANAQAMQLAGSPLATVFRLAYAELQKVMGLRKGRGDGLPEGLMANIKRALSRGAAAEATKLARSVTFLATCANTSPFIGLFGTVWGIMDAFSNIGALKTANLATVAPGIAEALVATATGLFAAIPAVVFFNHFNRRIQVLEAEMDTFSQDFLNLVELEVMSRQSSRETTRPTQA